MQYWIVTEKMSYNKTNNYYSRLNGEFDDENNKGIYAD